MDIGREIEQLGLDLEYGKDTTLLFKAMLNIIEEQQCAIQALENKVEYLTYNVVYNDHDNND